MNRSIGWRSAEPRVVAADLRDPVAAPGRTSTNSSVRSQPPVEVGQNPCVDDVGGRVEPRGQHPDRALVRREEQPFLRTEVQEDRALGDPDLVGDVLDARAAEAVLGEVPHRDLDDPLAPLLGLGGRAWLRARPRAAHDRSGRTIVEPEGPPVRLPPKRSAPVSPSGSSAPSDLAPVAKRSGPPAVPRASRRASHLRRPAVAAVRSRDRPVARGSRRPASRPVRAPWATDPRRSRLAAAPVGRRLGPCGLPRRRGSIPAV